MGRLLQNFTSLKAQAVGSSSISSWSSTLKNLCESLSVVESDWNPAKRIKEVWFPSPFDTGRAGEGWGGSGVLGTEGVGYTGLQALVKTEASSTFGHLILDSTFFKDRSSLLFRKQSLAALKQELLGTLLSKYSMRIPRRRES